jgi:hypothetical protein
MKTKKIHRKLVLNKITIANLIGNGMRRIYGGAPKETVKNSRCLTCVETDACETDACETLEPVCPPPPSSVANSCVTLCYTVCNC